MISHRSVILHQLMQLHHHCAETLDWCLTPHNVTYWQWRVLKEVCRKKSTLLELAERLKLKKEHLTTLIDILESEQYLRQEVEEKTFLCFFAATPVGERVYRQSITTMRWFANKLFCRCGEAEIQVFSNTLAEMTDQLNIGFLSKEIPPFDMVTSK